jgi:hypothetical protein
MRTQYGPFMSTEEVAEILKMSVAGLRMAQSRKKLPLRPLDIEWRRGQLYSTDDVAELISSSLTRAQNDVLADLRPADHASRAVLTAAECPVGPCVADGAQCTSTPERGRTGAPPSAYCTGGLSQEIAPVSPNGSSSARGDAM